MSGSRKEESDVFLGRREGYIPSAKKTSLTEGFPRSIAPSLRIGNQRIPDRISVIKSIPAKSAFGEVVSQPIMV